MPLLSAPAPQGATAITFWSDLPSQLDYHLQEWKDLGYKVRIARLDPESRQRWGVDPDNLQYLISGYRIEPGTNLEYAFNFYSWYAADVIATIELSGFCRAAGISLEESVIAQIRELPVDRIR